jgi:hypothetical protein
LEHLKLEGLYLDAMSIGIVGGFFVIFLQVPLSYESTKKKKKI